MKRYLKIGVLTFILLTFLSAVSCRTPKENYQGLNSELDAAQAKVKTLQDELEKLQSTVPVIPDDYQQLKNNLAASEANYAVTKTQLDIVQNSLKNTSIQLSKMKANFEDASAQLTAMKSDFDYVSIQLANMKASHMPIPKLFSSRQELEDWLKKNPVSEEPPLYAGGPTINRAVELSRAVELWFDALKDGYAIWISTTVTETGVATECWTIIETNTGYDYYRWIPYLDQINFSKTLLVKPDFDYNAFSQNSTVETIPK